MSWRETVFDGHAALELMTGGLRLVVVTGIGPRIASLSLPDGENLLYWDEDGSKVRGNWALRGGHRVWCAGPLADEREDTYGPDNEPCRVEEQDGTLTVTGAVDPQNMTQRGLSIEVVDEQTVLVDHFVTNTGEMLYAAGIWALTCTLPTDSTRYFVPLGDDSRWDYTQITSFRTWGGHSAGHDDDQFAVTEDLFVVSPKGRENKRMIMAQRGFQAMTDPARGVTFCKHTAFDSARGLQYPLGTNIAFYVGPENFMVEMESMGPAATLLPDQTAHHCERWRLLPEATDPKNWRSLV